MNGISQDTAVFLQNIERRRIDLSHIVPQSPMGPLSAQCIIAQMETKATWEEFAKLYAIASVEILLSDAKSWRMINEYVDSRAGSNGLDQIRMLSRKYAMEMLGMLEG